MERRNWQMRFHMAAQQAGENERVATGGVMRVIPAIDLKDGRCVRLRQGDMGAETVYSARRRSYSCRRSERSRRWGAEESSPDRSGHEDSQREGAGGRWNPDH